MCATFEKWARPFPKRIIQRSETVALKWNWLHFSEPLSQYHFIVQECWSTINDGINLSSLLTYTNLIVHESLQALDKFVLVPLINILLPEKNKTTKRKLWLICKQPGPIKITPRWDVIGDHLLFLVQQLLQSIQKKTKTLMTEVMNPTRKNTHKEKQLPNIQ